MKKETGTSRTMSYEEALQDPSLADMHEAIRFVYGKPASVLYPRKHEKALTSVARMDTRKLFKKSLDSVLLYLFIIYHSSLIIFLKLQNVKFCCVPNGVVWSSLTHRILSKLAAKTVVKAVSSYCLMGKPLHFSGPLSEKVPIVR